MALSSLQAQLAALNNPKQAGLSIPSNKRHDDAAGRGLHYSVHHGQAVADKAVQYKATLLHASARDAADIPLKVLEEKCKEALDQLDLDDLVPVLCDREASPPEIKATLLHLTCCFSESQEECLHVLEFMLRKYNLHSNFSAELLWTLLPYADTKWLYFHRCLQLVDLTADQSYVWLRPYVAADAGTFKKLPQSLLTQHIFKNPSWLTRLMELVQSVKSEPDHCVLSWSVNIMVKGFAWLARDAKTDKEAVVRTIFPYLMTSFGHSVRQMWGYLVVSSMAEHMNLADDTVDLLTRKILSHVDTGLEARSDAITTVLSILLPPRRQLMVDESCYLPLIGQNKWLGCPLSEATHAELIAVDWLPLVLGYLHHSRRVLVAPLVAAILVRSLAQGQTAVLIKLVKESQLLSLWRDGRFNLVASISAIVFEKGMQSKGLTLDAWKQVLKHLSEIDGGGCDKGIAQSLASHSNHIRDSKKEIIRLVRGIVSFDETLLAESDDFHAILSHGASENADTAGDVDKESGKEDDETKNIDDVEMILDSWAQSEDSALAKMVSQLRSDKVLLDKLRFAIILEYATRPETQSRDIVKLISSAISALDRLKHLHCGFLPGLALLQHPDARVREVAIDMLEGIGQLQGEKNKWSIITSICNGLKTKKVSIKMGGHVLSDLFVSCLAGKKEAGKLTEQLLEMCVCSAACVVEEVAKIGPDIFTKSWLPVSAAAGSNFVVSVILDSLELMGEDLCPLSTRWYNAGHHLLVGLLKHGSTMGASMTLIRPLVKMLKGVKVVDPHIIVSSGPNSRGGRTRSYSVGKVDGVAVLQPYPAEMRKMVVLVLEESNKTPAHEMLASLVVSDVIMSASWRNGVFAKFNPRDRRSIASAIVSYAAKSTEEDVLQAFMALPLDSSDVCVMLNEKNDESKGIRITYLSDFVRQNASHIWTSRQGTELLNDLVKVLLTLSSAANNVDCEGDDVTFIQRSMLAAIEELLVSRPSSEQKIDGHYTEAWLTAILSLLSNTSTMNGALLFFKKLRLRSSAFSIVSHLISAHEKQISFVLDDMLGTAVELSCGNDSSYTQHARQCFEFLVPLYKKCDSLPGLTLERLFTTLIRISFEKPDEQRLRLFQDLSHVLEEGCLGSRDVAGLLGLYLAYRSHAQESFNGPEAVQTVVQLLANMARETQIATLLAILDYINDMISFLTQPNMEQKEVSLQALYCVTLEDLFGAASNGFHYTGIQESLSSPDAARIGYVIELAKSLLDAFGDCLLLDGVKLYFRRTGIAAGKCLEIWQKLLEIHAIARNKSDSRDTSIQQFLKYAVDSLDQSRGMIQTLLPVHIFLASITSIITEGRTADVRSNALHLVAERVAGVAPSSPEALLFVDLVPEITKILESKNKTQSDSATLSESALIALEQICVVIRSSKALRDESVNVFVGALMQVSELLKTFHNVPSLDSLGSNERQLMCSLALCSGSIIRSVGVAVVAILPTLMHSLVTMLSSAATYSGKFEEEIKILRLSIVKTLAAIVESVPQLLTRHLDSMITEEAILSESLRSGTTDKFDSLRRAIERLDLSLANSVPCRILIPALCRSVTDCSTITGTRAVMAILEKVLNEVSSAEASVQRNVLLKTVMLACDVIGTFEERLSIISVCETVLISLVMKLSELQLRRAFVSLREWNSMNTSRKFAFWTFSRALSQKLKGIFLPLLSMVFSDAVVELNTTSEANETARSKSKKRRLNEDESKQIDEESVRFLEPLLMCLETALRTDARGGGSWIRSDEDNRYHALLSPLGNLLEGHLSGIVSQTGTRSVYHELVYGKGDESGSVIGCITALAAAAGNEQLWKPLNHTVLSACACEDRADVRRAGLECLLSLMRSLGEEYMVLLPECLPILSEALEDLVEDNAILAREIVSVAEELIGESLQESLR